MSDSGAGGDHTLGTNYNISADSGGITNMGVGVQGEPGLTFDTGFNANYWFGVTAGGNTNVGVYANYEVICSNCYGAYIGNAAPTNAITDNSNGGNDPADACAGVQIAINNSATNGVWGDINGCTVVGGCPSNCPPSVTTGVEMAIPLSAIGSPQSSVSVCAFIVNQFYTALYNQVLGPITDGSPTDCWYAATMTPDDSGYSSAVNFSALPGQHYFTISVPSCNSPVVSPTSASFSDSVGTGTVSVTACSWTASTSTSWVSIVSGAVGSGSGTITYSVSTNTSIRPRTANVYVGLTFPNSSAILTQTVAITQAGVTLAPLGVISVNGTWKPAYGCPLAVQAIGTSWGKPSGTRSAGTENGGSELDAAYGLIQNDVLFLLFTGDLESNGNQLNVFFMSGPGGTNTLYSGQATNVGNNVLNAMGTPTNTNVGGLTFDPGFAPNYWLGVNIGSYFYYLDYAQLWPGGTNASGQCTNGYYVGGNGALTNASLYGGSVTNPYGVPNPFNIQGTINNSNVFGIDGSGCVTNTVAGGPFDNLPNSLAATSAVDGLEFAIPLAALGSPTGAIAVCAFVGNKQGNYMSNQILPPIDPTATVTNQCAYNESIATGSFSNVNFGNLPGGPHYFYVGPEMRVTGISRVISGGATNVNVNVLPEYNTNLLYQLQRTFAPLTATSTWAQASGYVNGTNSTLTLTDTHATNKVGTVGGILYRVLQVPNCTTAP